MTSEVAAAFISGGTAILIVVLTPIVDKIIKRFNKKDPLKEAIEINNLIINKLEDVKNSYKADRIWLCQFHNGGVFYPTGKSIQKFSMIYEVLNSNVSSQQNQLQNIPTGLFSKPINILEGGNVVKILNYKDYDTYGLSSLAESTGTKSTYLFPLITIHDKLIGFVGMDFHKETLLEDMVLAGMELEVNSIGGTLMNEYLNKK